MERCRFKERTITIRGYKGHSSRVFKLKDLTLAMLKLYLAKRKDRSEVKGEIHWETKKKDVVSGKRTLK